MTSLHRPKLGPWALIGLAVLTLSLLPFFSGEGNHGSSGSPPPPSSHTTPDHSSTTPSTPTKPAGTPVAQLNTPTPAGTPVAQLNTPTKPAGTPMKTAGIPATTSSVPAGTPSTLATTPSAPATTPSTPVTFPTSGGNSLPIVPSQSAPNQTPPAIRTSVPQFTPQTTPIQVGQGPTTTGYPGPTSLSLPGGQLQTPTLPGGQLQTSTPSYPGPTFGLPSASTTASTGNLTPSPVTPFPTTPLPTNSFPPMNPTRGVISATPTTSILRPSPTPINALPSTGVTQIAAVTSFVGLSIVLIWLGLTIHGIQRVNLANAKLTEQKAATWRLSPLIEAINELQHTTVTEMKEMEGKSQEISHILGNAQSETPQPIKPVDQTPIVKERIDEKINSIIDNLNKDTRRS